MMREKYESLPLATLKDLAKARGLKGISTMKKAELIERMLEEDEKEKKSARETVKELSANTGDKEVHDIDKLDSGITAHGILEVVQDGYGFIRSANYLPGENDVYVSPSQIRRFNLKTGDILEGNTRIKTQQEKFSALLYLSKINEMDPMKAMHRKNFEDMTPIFPNERIRLEVPGAGMWKDKYCNAHYGFDVSNRKRTERYDRLTTESRKDNLIKAGCIIRTKE